MGNFLNVAAKKKTDVRGFLREAAGGNSIKYAAEKGAKHIIYIPYRSGKEIIDGKEEVTREIIAISGDVHEWNGLDGKYRATVCLKDIIRKSEDGETLLNDGTCPFCDRIQDAWDIFKYRKAQEEEKCNLVGVEREKYIEKINAQYSNERKAKEARSYIYILVVKFRTGANGSEVIGPDGLPEYDLKVMKLSSSRVEKIQQTVANAGSELPGSELMIEYPNSEDRRLVVSQSTTAPVFPARMQITKHPALVDKINQDVAKFEWDGIEKSFTEWNGMTSMEAKEITNNLFETWDKYKKDVKINPAIKYMEYINDTPMSTPSLTGGVDTVAPPVVPGAVGAIPAAPVIPGAPVLADAPDVNSIFGSQPSGINI